MKKISLSLILAIIAIQFFVSSCKKKSDDPTPSSSVPTCATPTPTPTVTAGGATTFCEGGSVLLTSSSAGAGTYQWYKGGVAISAATNSTYTATTSGSYTVVVTLTCPSPASSPISVTVETPLLSQEDIVYSGTSSGSQKNVYKYNANKKLAKIEYTSGSTYYAFDSIIYNGNNEIVTVKTYSVGAPTVATQINTYTYTSGKITSVHEVGDNGSPYDRIRTFTYTSGVLSAQTVAYTTGSSGGGPENLTSIVFTNGNISSAYLGAPYGTATLTANTTAPNPYFGLNNDSEDILGMFNANNITNIDASGPPAANMFSRTYTYSNGRVATSTETSGTDVTTITYTYACP